MIIYMYHSVVVLQKKRGQKSTGGEEEKDNHIRVVKIAKTEI